MPELQTCKKDICLGIDPTAAALPLRQAQLAGLATCFDTQPPFHKQAYLKLCGGNEGKSVELCFFERQYYFGRRSFNLEQRRIAAYVLRKGLRP